VTDNEWPLEADFSDFMQVTTASSPCVRECKLGEDHCMTCGRSLKDIQDWRDYSEDKRKGIMKSLEGKKNV
jgi:predicted Fe-S protein YdhL (DUF1289 family)